MCARQLYRIDNATRARLRTELIHRMRLHLGKRPSSLAGGPASVRELEVSYQYMCHPKIQKVLCVPKLSRPIVARNLAEAWDYQAEICNVLIVPSA